MSSDDDFAIQAVGLGKTFRLYERPIDRLKQLLWGRRREYGRSFVALDDISFTVPRGQVLGVVGQNGAGKSTLLQLLCGTLTPTHGSITVRGRIAALLELGAGFNPEFSGRENVFLNGSILGLSYAEISARYDEIVSFSGVESFIDQPVKTYSSGMYVRLAFSIATAVDPDILVIDEALSVGDGAFARKSFDRIMALKARGATILFCSHSMYHIEAICDSALWLDHGRSMLLDTPGPVVKAYMAYQSPEALGTPAVDSVDAPSNSLSSPNTAQGRLLRVTATVDGISGQKLKVKSGVSSLTLVISFQSDPSLPPPSVAFGLETSSGISVTSGSTHFDACETTLDASGRGEVTLCFPAISLMRGEYRLTVFLACERVIHVYDHALYCVELLVEHPGIEQGLVFLPHRWNEGALVCVP